jgi:hypothetical protein
MWQEAVQVTTSVLDYYDKEGENHENSQTFRRVPSRDLNQSFPNIKYVCLSLHHQTRSKYDKDKSKQFVFPHYISHTFQTIQFTCLSNIDLLPFIMIKYHVIRSRGGYLDYKKEKN